MNRQERIEQAESVMIIDLNATNITDTKGRVWPVRMSRFTRSRCILAGVYLPDLALRGKPREELVAALWHCCELEASARQVSREDFTAALDDASVNLFAEWLPLMLACADTTPPSPAEATLAELQFWAELAAGRDDPDQPPTGCP